jgi:hypothetical protein
MLIAEPMDDVANCLPSLENFKSIRPVVESLQIIEESFANGENVFGLPYQPCTIN